MFCGFDKKEYDKILAELKQTIETALNENAALKAAMMEYFEPRKKAKEELITYEQACQYLGIANQTLRNWASRGLIKDHGKYRGRKGHFKLSEIKKLDADKIKSEHLQHSAACAYKAKRKKR